ncbi:hypothetical protein [Candidatus Thiothrix anitrata]|uniref:Uncharacterized protein n=1 Tax=Candidatus Thiothrix anitrata TaxID=2823902 RepID=A0ABX7X5U3_9GAMM|nr:hypothetical protein [Candidatus Thiothrix anitrata]QTR51246.1 hypothetical protein J8380_06770 [Candidatus Thiothrix anitrata]
MKKNGPVTIMTLLYLTIMAVIVLTIFTLAAEEKIEQAKKEMRIQCVTNSKRC